MEYKINLASVWRVDLDEEICKNRARPIEKQAIEGMPQHDSVYEELILSSLHICHPHAGMRSCKEWA